MTSIFVQARRQSGAISAAALALLIATPGPALAADDDNYPDPVYMTGAEVRIDRAIEGDLIAAAGRIHVDQPVGGDAVLAAGSLVAMPVRRVDSGRRSSRPSTRCSTTPFGAEPRSLVRRGTEIPRPVSGMIWITMEMRTTPTATLRT